MGTTSAPGTQDPLVGDLRRAGLLPLLVLHFAGDGPCYGSKLIARIGQLTGGAVSVNPNTMYPLLKTLEEKGFLSGEWEDPNRHSRRFYTITAAGEEERRRLAGELAPRLERIQASLEAIRGTLGLTPR